MQNDRRTFLKSFGGVTAAVVAGSKLVRPTLAETPDADEHVALSPAAVLRRPPHRVLIGLYLEGERPEQSFAGWLSSAQGGGAQGEVVTDSSQAGIVKKHIGGVKYEDITVNCGTGMSKAFYEWIKATFDGKPTRKSGAIVAADFDGSIVDTLSFKDALISEVGFPSLDAGSKDAAKVVLKISPAAAVFDLGNGGKIELPAVQKQFLPSNFKIEIDGMDAATLRVSKIDSFTIKQAIIEGAADKQLEFSNLSLFLPENSSSDVFKWHESFLDTNNSDNPDALEKQGSLTFMTADQQEFLKISFANLGPFKVSPPAPSDDKIRTVKAEFYCESIKFDYKTSLG